MYAIESGIVEQSPDPLPNLEARKKITKKERHQFGNLDSLLEPESTLKIKESLEYQSVLDKSIIDSR